MSVLRWDRAALSRAGKTPSGGLRLRARIARTGLQSYRQPDGSTRWEYRPAEEVFADESLASFVGAPLTLGHPSAVSPASWARDAVGLVSAQPDRTTLHDGHDWLEVFVDINRADAIAQVERGDLQELSVGYRADFDPTPGEFNGKRYDGIQRRIRANHVALLPRGNARAGREARLLTDADEVTLWLDGAGDQLNELSLDEIRFSAEMASYHSRFVSNRRAELEHLGRLPVFETPKWLQDVATTTDADDDEHVRSARLKSEAEFEANMRDLHVTRSFTRELGQDPKLWRDGRKGSK